MDFLTLGTSIVSSSIITLVINNVIKGGISNYYKKQVEYFKDEIAQLAEKRKLDFERKVFDFSQYSVKRHEIYPLIYKQILIAKSYIFSLRGYTKQLTFEEFNVQDIISYLDSKKIPQGKITEISSLWGTDKNDAIEITRKYLNEFKYHEAEDELIKANNIFLEYELYLPEHNCLIISALLKELDGLLLVYQTYRVGDRQVFEESRKLQEEILTSIDLLKVSLRAELSKGLS